MDKKCLNCELARIWGRVKRDGTPRLEPHFDYDLCLECGRKHPLKGVKEFGRKIAI